MQIKVIQFSALTFHAVYGGSAALFGNCKLLAADRAFLTAFAVSIEFKNIFAGGAVELTVVGKSRTAGSYAFFQNDLYFGNEFFCFRKCFYNFSNL